MTLLSASVLDTTLIVVLGLAGCIAIRRRSAALRHLVLGTTVALAMLAPAFELLIPQLTVFEHAADTNAPPSVVTVSQLTSELRIDGLEEGPSQVSWTTIAGYVWLAGSAMMLAVLGTSLLRLVRLVRGSTPIRQGPWPATAAVLADTLGVRRPVTILMSANRALLVTCGPWRPKIILPAGADGWPHERRCIVLAHELAHIRRHDGLVLLAAELLRAAHWFNPIVWVACRRLREESEYACDDRVLATGIAPTEYAGHLLDVARHAAGHPRAWGPTPAIAHPSTLERRVAAMLNSRQNRESVTRRTRSWVVGALVAASVSLAAVDVVTSPALDSMGPVVASEPLVPMMAVPAAVPAAAPESRATVDRATRPRRFPAPASVMQTPVATTGQAKATLAGAVVDQTGGAIPGATLTLTPADSAVRQQTLTAGDGRFAFRDLEAGQYTLVVSALGFTRVSSDLAVGPGAAVDRVLTLPLGTLDETIVIQCSATQAGRIEPATRQRAQGPFGWFAATTIHRGLREVAKALVPVVLAAQQDMRPVRVGGAIRPPRKVTDVRPVCPTGALPTVETTVRMVARIGTDGMVRDATHVAAARDSVPSGALIDASLAAVRQWTYTPALLNGRPVDVQMAITFTYQPRR